MKINIFPFLFVLMTCCGCTPNSTSHNFDSETEQIEIDSPPTPEIINKTQHPVRVPVIQRGHSWEINSVAFHPNSQRIISGSRDDSIKIWDVKSGAVITTIEGHSLSVNEVSFSPDGKYFASISNDGIFQIRSAKTGLLVAKENNLFLESMVWSPDSTKIATGSRQSSKIIVWELSPVTEDLIKIKISQKIIFEQEDGVNCLAWSPNGAYLASGSVRKKITIFNTQKQEIFKIFTDNYKGYGGIMAIAFSPDSTHLAAGGWDKKINFWDIKKGKISRTLTGHSGIVFSISFSPDGDLLASGSDDKTLKIWDVKSGNFLFSHPEATNTVTSVRIDPSGSTVMSGSYDGHIRLYDLKTGVLKYTTPVATQAGARRMEFNKSGTSFAILGSGQRGSVSKNVVTLWNTETGTPIKIKIFDDPKRELSVVSLSPDGSLLAIGVEKDIQLWNVTPKKLIATFDNLTNEIRELAFSPNGKWFISTEWPSEKAGSRHQMIRIWDTETLQQLTTISGTPTTKQLTVAPDNNKNFINCFSWSNDGKFFAAGHS